jgi:hypothetical protein
VVWWVIGLVFLAFFPKLFGIYYTNVVVTMAIFAVYSLP